MWKKVDPKFIYERNVYLMKYTTGFDKEKQTIDVCLSQVPGWVAQHYTDMTEEYRSKTNPLNLRENLEGLSIEDQNRYADYTDRLRDELKSIPRTDVMYRFHCEDELEFNKDHPKGEPVLASEINAAIPINKYNK